MDNILRKICVLDDSDSFVLGLIEHWRSENKTIVFTNGCFDILHFGHVSYLSDAKDMGDKLIIAINTDDSIRRLKGEGRPINELDSRMVVLASMECVDMVIPFKEDTPLKLIEQIIPDILVKGADYKKEDIVGYDVVTKSGGKVETVDYLKGYSVTEMVKKIKK
jgi:D-beta-D-heptose 7-phosphate kinase/D-beta-D-heptose 1-phosphate adenosyltransferase